MLKCFNMLIRIISGIFCCVFLALDHYFRITLHSGLGFSLLFKMLASISFIVSGFYSYFTNKEKSALFNRTAVLILAGLCSSILADFFLELNFYAGFLLFVSAHVLYFLAFSVYSKMSLKKWIFVISFLIIFTVFDLLVPWFDFGILFPFVVLYSGVWTFVMAKGAESFMWNSVEAKLVPVGIGLFGISDILLQFTLFAVADFPSNAVNVIFIVSNFFYYSAQHVLAYSIGKDYLEK